MLANAAGYRIKGNGQPGKRKTGGMIVVTACLIHNLRPVFFGLCRLAGHYGIHQFLLQFCRIDIVFPVQTCCQSGVDHAAIALIEAV
ncbi:hypothetical protein D3C73_1512440 [compost metagenome]